MNLDLVEQIGRATLYEGYMLYPYRPSSVKNQQRFNFGVLYPRSYSDTQGGADACSMQTECLVQSNGSSCALDVRLRFLHLVQRQIGHLAAPVLELNQDALDFQPVESLTIGDQTFQTWQEAVEEEVRAPIFNLSELEKTAQRVPFSLPSWRSVEAIREDSGLVIGVTVREQQRVTGTIEIAAQREGKLTRVTVVALNQTPLENPSSTTRDEALLRSTVSTHTILGVADAEFISLLDPPQQFRAAASGCKNIGAWPVLVGNDGQRDTMLSSPIILYDYPQIAPESAGDLFDGTEIDEILTLRIMTLTDDEKREMRSADDRARKILERTESLPVEQFMKMHGAVRGLKRVVKG
jgi:hydrogenase maturation protease